MQKLFAKTRVESITLEEDVQGRACARLVQVLQYENFEFTKLLLKNRLKILCPSFSPCKKG